MHAYFIIFNRIFFYLIIKIKIIIMVTKEEEVAYFWHTYLWMYFATQAVIGIIIFEYSWAKTSRYREGNEEINASYPTAN